MTDGLLSDVLGLMDEANNQGEASDAIRKDGYECRKLGVGRYLMTRIDEAETGQDD